MENDLSLQSMARRIEELERQNRLMRKGFVVLVLLTALVLTLGDAGGLAGAEESGRVVEAERFVLRDSEGKVRAELGMDTGAPRLALYSTENKPVVTLWGTDGLPSVSVNPRGGVLGGAIICASELVPGMSTYVPCKGEWLALDVTARYNSSWGLTDDLQVERLQVDFLNFPTDGVKVRAWVSTTTQPVWNVHTGRGKFSVSDREVRATYQEAADELIQLLLEPAFSSLADDSEIEIAFAIRGFPVGSWRNGVMTLKGE